MPIKLPFVVIPVPLGVVTTGNELSNRKASHLGRFSDPGMVWQSSGNANLWVRGNFGSAKEVDFVSLISANAQVGSTARLRLGDTQAEVDGVADYDSAAQLIISPSITREDGRYVWHFELPSIQTKQWWRIDIGSHTGDFIAAALVLGKRATAADFYNADSEFGMIDTSSFELGRFGVLREEEGLAFHTLVMNFGFMTAAQTYSEFMQIRRKLGRRGAGFWCFDPEPSIYRQQKTYFGWLSEIPLFKPSLPDQSRFQVSFSITSMI